MFSETTGNQPQYTNNQYDQDTLTQDEENIQQAEAEAIAEGRLGDVACDFYKIITSVKCPDIDTRSNDCTFSISHSSTPIHALVYAKDKEYTIVFTTSSSPPSANIIPNEILVQSIRRNLSLEGMKRQGILLTIYDKNSYDKDEKWTSVEYFANCFDLITKPSMTIPYWTSQAFLVLSFHGENLRMQDYINE